MLTSVAGWFVHNFLLHLHLLNGGLCVFLLVFFAALCAPWATPHSTERSSTSASSSNSRWSSSLNASLRHVISARHKHPTEHSFVAPSCFLSFFSFFFVFVFCSAAERWRRSVYILSSIRSSSPWTSRQSSTTPRYVPHLVSPFAC